jgi:hypothetical protein
MELSTIQRIEQYMVDALIASPLIPLNVNVLRLADAIENEGVVSQTNNIVVRYTGSTDNVKNRIPMVFERRMSFELNFSCQNYLSSSGHDFATQLITGAFITLNGGVPSGAFVQVIEPFTCGSEQYTGLTENSQYTYTQTYTVTIEEALPFVALDPCVQRGDCRQIFPGYGVETRLPLGGIVDDASGSIYVPSYTCTPQFTPDECCNPLDPQAPPMEDFDGCLGIRWSNELTASGDWVFICDPTCVFLPDPMNQPIYMLSNNNAANKRILFSKEIPKELEKAMDDSENDLVNKRINPTLLNRQKNIETRLLEAEKAIKEQELDPKRKSNSGITFSKPSPPELTKFKFEKQKQLELIRTTPPNFTPFYKKQTDNYFKKIN